MFKDSAYGKKSSKKVDDVGRSYITDLRKKKEPASTMSNFGIGSSGGQGRDPDMDKTQRGLSSFRNKPKVPTPKKNKKIDYSKKNDLSSYNPQKEAEERRRKELFGAFGGGSDRDLPQAPQKVSRRKSRDQTSKPSSGGTSRLPGLAGISRAPSKTEIEKKSASRKEGSKKSSLGIASDEFGYDWENESRKSKSKHLRLDC